ncbi:hypothetical protein A2291_06865 [candidate division WOR-1 bacterium RIFOXYB2_FULL_42_35]|uniref:Tc1-like transposase DDE domain-containing protein n=1 Tax=candidate division WOR-1 bacterium RIFOXYC2_FULL_41_25 TaxID=1802586 RepID=A0A1F4TPR1_UNCSA|nr:MAG: hypothetical protein A2291_06865 [candidate division WOR-1 bacterium RIFOXYB2_FULL_42_35]OGC24600.1 MAG: hypothetical protein A2247_06645 [candidate division WOR-1 bacterium RIFOXYA2_FULL_41_14]OGC34646.1 MAG: hypothetical protein A2462_04880 [candidate division WOR-1 bacterium RIFOXYC2_FULL_41_25]OGC41595.1 MAG: hypothetical protein A2548_01195 [candidate division WOR-1 bacterium RIFOXYD2_FULL_41_8]
MLYLDRAGWHTGRKVKQLPAYSPQLNPVERVWKLLRLNVTHNRFYQFVTLFESALSSFLKSISRKHKKIHVLCHNI